MRFLDTDTQIQSMHKRESLRKPNPKFIAGLLIALAIAILLFISAQRNSVDKNETTSNNKVTQQELEEQQPIVVIPEQKSEFKIAYSIGETHNIRQVINDGQILPISIVSINTPKTQVDCDLDIIKLEGVSLSLVQSLKFSISANATSANRGFSLGEGKYRTDITCKYDDEPYAANYIIELVVEQRNQTPVSY